MEKEIKIKTPDGHLIYGTVRAPKSGGDTLLIFIHGLTGHQNEHIFYNGARFFEKRGIATFRFDLYTGEKKGRTLTDCSIQTHADDLNTVVKFFRKKFNKIFVAGHSLGGLTILFSHADFVGGVILWDSSCSLMTLGEQDDLKYNKKLDCYLESWGPEFLMGKKMYNEWKKFPIPKVAIAKIKQPVKVIVAGKGILIKAGKEYFKYAGEPKEFAVIPGAGHNFNEEGTEQKLFTETYNFVRKHAK